MFSIIKRVESLILCLLLFVISFFTACDDNKKYPINVKKLDLGSEINVTSNTRFIILNNEMYLISNEHLFKYDEYSGLTLVSNVNYSNNNRNICIFNNKLFFYYMHILYSYDGNNEPVPVHQFEYDGTDLAAFTVCNNKLYFFALTEYNGYYDLWSYDGLSEPIMLYEASYLLLPEGIITYVYNNNLYFTTKVDSSSTYLVRYYDDGAIVNISEIPLYQMLYHGTFNPSFNSITIYNDDMIFPGKNSQYGYELWSYDGSFTKRISDINTGELDSKPTNYCVFNNNLYFTANRDDVGMELFVYNGQDSPTLVADIIPGTDYSYPDNLIVIGDKLYFSAFDSNFKRKIWIYDGEIPPYPLDNLNDGLKVLNPMNYKVYNNRVYFIGYTLASDNSEETEIFYFDLSED